MLILEGIYRVYMTYRTYNRYSKNLTNKSEMIKVKLEDFDDINFEYNN